MHSFYEVIEDHFLYYRINYGNSDGFIFINEA